MYDYPVYRDLGDYFRIAGDSPRTSLFRFPRHRFKADIAHFLSDAGQLSVTGIITTYLVLRLLVRSGFLDTYPVPGVSDLQWLLPSVEAPCLSHLL